MIPLYSEEEFKKAKHLEKLPCQCVHCGKTFYKTKKLIKECLKHKWRSTGEFCSAACFNHYTYICVIKPAGTKIYTPRTAKIDTNCSCCGTSIQRTEREINKSKSKKFFCSKLCFKQGMKYFRSNRSALERYIEQSFNELNLEIPVLFNNKSVISAELDIYFPTLNIAFEINGIFHFLPIFGDDKLAKTKAMDEFKKSECLNKGITLNIIDVSQYRRELDNKTSIYYFNYILDEVLKFIN